MFSTQSSLSVEGIVDVMMLNVLVSYLFSNSAKVHSHFIIQSANVNAKK